jgi:hypothetical protein
MKFERSDGLGCLQGSRPSDKRQTKKMDSTIVPISVLTTGGDCLVGAVTPPEPCAICGAELLPIVYGYPPPVEQARRGNVIIGGCLVSDDSPHGTVPPAVSPRPSNRLLSLIGRERLDKLLGRE